MKCIATQNIYGLPIPMGQCGEQDQIHPIYHISREELRFCASKPEHCCHHIPEYDEFAEWVSETRHASNSN